MSESKSVKRQLADATLSWWVRKGWDWISDNWLTALLVILVPQASTVLVALSSVGWLLPVGVGLAVLFASIVLASQIAVRKLIAGLPSEPNYKEWSKVRLLRIWDIAHLWVGIEPPDSSVRTPERAAYPVFRRLKIDVVSGVLPIAGKGARLAETLISHDAIIKYTEADESQPLFVSYLKAGKK